MFKTILVTGAGGYIPVPLIKILLEKQYNVIGLDNGFGRGLDGLIELCSNKNFEFVKGNVNDEKLMTKLLAKSDIVIGAAALVGEPLCDKFVDLAWSVNAESFNLIHAISPLKPIIMMSTGSVYGAIKDICTEQSECNPISVYAKSKLLGESYVAKNPHIIYRFATAFGLASSSFRLDLLVNDLVYQAIRNKTITLFQADFRRTFCHVRDIVDAVVFGIENFDKMQGQIYNVGHNLNNWTKKQLAEFIKLKTGCSIFYGDSGYVDSDKRDYEVSYNKINNMGWEAKIDMETGINELIKVVPLLNMKNLYNFVG